MLTRTLRAALLSAVFGGVAFSTAAQAQDQKPAAEAAAPAAAAPAAQAAAPQQDDPVVARVNGKEIRRSELGRVLNQLPPQIRQVPMEMLYPALVDQLVNEALITAAGYKEKVEESQAVKEALKQAEAEAVRQVFMERQVDARITPEALDQAYKDYVQQNPPEKEVRASHILVKTEDEAKAILKELAEGGDFAKIAQEKSTDKSAAAQGGDLGYFTKDMMVGPFAEAAFAMEPGQVSKQPVQTQFGWHVIKVADARMQAAPTLEEVAPALRQELGREIVSALLNDLRSAAQIETFAPDGSPMPKPEAPPQAQ